MPCHKHNRMVEPDKCPDCVREDRDRLAIEIASMKAEHVERSRTDPVERLHNLCHIMEGDDVADCYSQDEWDRLDKENVRLTNIAKKQKSALDEIIEFCVSAAHLPVMQDCLSKIMLIAKAGLETKKDDPKLTTQRDQLKFLLQSNHLLRMVYTEANNLRERGYDGPFMGTEIEPLFIALSAVDNLHKEKIKNDN